MLLQRNDSSEQFTVFSLGNFVSNQRTAPRDGGAMVRLDLVKNDGVTTIANAGYFLTWVWLPKVQGKVKYVIMPASQYENDLETMDAASRVKMKAYLDASRLLLNAKNQNVHEYRYSPEAGWLLFESE
jgi:poly-gamma-glutamate synthesis protein (capsule biosynthesis protein)